MEKHSKDCSKASSEFLEAGWFDPHDLPADLGFDNGPRIRAWIREVRGDRGASG